MVHIFPSFEIDVRTQVDFAVDDVHFDCMNCMIYVDTITVHIEVAAPTLWLVQFQLNPP